MPFRNDAPHRIKKAPKLNALLLSLQSSNLPSQYSNLVLPESELLLKKAEKDGSDVDEDNNFSDVP